MCGVVYYADQCGPTKHPLANFYDTLFAYESYLAWPWLVLAECVATVR